MDINIPDTVAEVEAAFWRYDQALIDNDVATLNELFWVSPHTLRYGPGENQYGHAAICAVRAARGNQPFLRKVTKLVVTGHGPDHATANCETEWTDTGVKARQSHTWVRFPEGWRIVAAHVSAL
jgi:AtzH-like